MTVQELENLISWIPKELKHCQVYISSDPEGNNYYKLRGLDDKGLLPQDGRGRSRIGSIGVVGESAKDNGIDLNDEEYNEYVNEISNRCVVLFP